MSATALAYAATRCAVNPKETDPLYRRLEIAGKLLLDDPTEDRRYSGTRRMILIGGMAVRVRMVLSGGTEQAALCYA
eukprot:3936501-Rhodomonas_salina.1